MLPAHVQPEPGVKPAKRTKLERDVDIAMALIHRAGAHKRLDALIRANRKSPRGRSPSVDSMTVLVGILVALMNGSPMYLTEAFNILSYLPRAVALRVGFIRTTTPEERRTTGLLRTTISHSSFNRAYVRMCDAVGAPVPEELRDSSKKDRRRWRPAADMTRICDELIAASFDTDELTDEGSLDSTGVLGHIRQTTSTDSIPFSSDPTAAWYVKRDIAMLGYSLTIITAKTTEGTTRIVGIEVQSGNASDLDAGADLVRRIGPKLRLRLLACDKGYTSGQRLFDAAIAAGTKVLYDLADHQQGHIGIHKGMPIVDAQCHCPGIPTRFLNPGIGPAPSKQNDVSEAAYKLTRAVRDKYAARLHGRPGPDGSARNSCPVLTGDAICPRRPTESANNDPATAAHVRITSATPESPLCTQRTVSVPGMIDGLYLQHSPAWGTPEFRAKYSELRNLVEGTFGNLHSHEYGRVKHGGVFLRGINKITLMLTLLMAAYNVRRKHATIKNYRDTKAIRKRMLDERDNDPNFIPPDDPATSDADGTRGPPTPSNPAG